MATALTVPLGPLLSFAPASGSPVTFDPGTTKLLAGWRIGGNAPPPVSIPGRFDTLDRWGGTLVGAPFDLTWEVLLHTPIGSTDLTHMQTVMDTLVNAMASGEAGTLSAQRYGGAGAASGAARLLEISGAADTVTWTRVHLHFYLPAGFS